LILNPKYPVALFRIGLNIGLCRSLLRRWGCYILVCTLFLITLRLGSLGDVSGGVTLGENSTAFQKWLW
jgi:hypothetical protein